MTLGKLARPGTRWAAGLVMLVAFVGASLGSAHAEAEAVSRATVAAALGWSPVAPTNGPPLPDVDLLRVAYDDATGQFLAYDPGFLGCAPPMWEWDGKVWTQLAAAAPLSGLTGSAFAYDTDTRQLLLVGGYQVDCTTGAPGHYVAGTWSWNGTRWVTLQPSTSPPAGAFGCAAYDALRHQLVMYGASTADGIQPVGDSATWTWDGSTWTPHSTSPAPPTPAVDCGMAFDATDGVIVLTSHNPAGGSVDTWTWNGTSWSEQASTGPQSISGEAPTLVYDPSIERVVLYIGEEPCQPTGFSSGDCLTPVSETWTWENGSWSLLPTSVAPTSRGDAAFGFDAGTAQLVLAGGLNQGSWLADTWAYSAGGGSGAQLQRIAGGDRDATAVAVSQAGFPANGSASSVVLARDDAFADGLVGAPLAAAQRGPLLLSPPGGLAAVTRTELSRVLKPGGTVYLLGGPNALSATVETQVRGLGFDVVRLAGADRYSTAVAVADALGDPSTVFEASGLAFPDALSATPAASREHGVVLLTAGSTQAGATATYLAAHPGTRYAVGGDAAKADPGAVALVGADRYATNAALARAFFPGTSSFSVATGQAFPDALAGGAYSAAHAQPLLLVPSAGAVSEPVAAYVSTHAYAVTSADVVGGQDAIGDAVIEQLTAILLNNS